MNASAAASLRIGELDAENVALRRRIGEQQQAARALAESEQRWRGNFELGLTRVAVTPPSKGCLEVNDELCRILGYTREELLQRIWAEMTHPDDLAADVANFGCVPAGEIDGYEMDKLWLRKDGQLVRSISVICLRGACGSVDYVLALLQDTSERKRAQHDFLEHAQVRGPACLVLDVSLPRLSGFELQHELARARARACRSSSSPVTATCDVGARDAVEQVFGHPKFNSSPTSPRGLNRPTEAGVERRVVERLIGRQPQR